MYKIKVFIAGFVILETQKFGAAITISLFFVVPVVWPLVSLVYWRHL